jgi:large subunit ribosomal protein L25
MAKQVKLSARPRSESGRNAVKQVRARGGVPAVIYGSKDKPANLEVSRRDIEALLSHAVGENILVDLQIEEGGKTTSRLSLIQEVQHHPLRREVLHVDFHAVSMTEKISADIVIESVGEPDGVKNFGGLLEQSMRSVTIRCLPQNLPEIIRVDVSALKIGDSIHVRDLPLPAGVEADEDADLTVFIVAEPAVAEEPVVAAAPESPEVIKEKKPDAAAAGAEEKK